MMNRPLPVAGRSGAWALVAALSLVVAGDADAAPVEIPAAVPPRQMSAQMHRYFVGEKRQSLVFMGIGLASLAFGGVAIARGGRLLRATSGPVIAIGLIQLGVGGAVYLRTDAQVQRLEARLRADSHAYSLEELTRVETVNRWFTVYKWVERGLLVGGAGLAVFGASRSNQVALGIGIGLAAQSAVMLVLDHFAAERALEYYRSLGIFRFNLDAGVFEDGAGRLAGALVQLTGRFR